MVRVPISMGRPAWCSPRPGQPWPLEGPAHFVDAADAADAAGSDALAARATAPCVAPASKAARASAQLINRFRSPYSDVSMAMIQRLDGKLGGKERKPENFEQAQGLGNQHFKAVQELRKDLEAAVKQGKPADEVKKIEQDLHTEMHDAAEMFQLAMN
mgnify:CR=1 FL=1